MRHRHKTLTLKSTLRTLQEGPGQGCGKGNWHKQWKTQLLWTGDALNFPLIRSRFSHWELVQSWDLGGPVYPLTLSFPNLSCSPTLGLQRLKRCERTACFLKRICPGLSSTVSSPSTFTGLVGSPGMSAAPQMISSGLSFRGSWFYRSVSAASPLDLNIWVFAWGTPPLSPVLLWLDVSESKLAL